MLARIPLLAVIMVACFSLVFLITSAPAAHTAPTSAHTAAVAAVVPAERHPLPVVSTSSPARTPATTTPPNIQDTPVASPVSKPVPAQEKESTNQALRIKDPYLTPPLSFDTVNTDARSATVNILCVGNGSVRPTSGSGVMIDPSGIILTNAHVAQYVLLSEDMRIDLTCTIRTGAPAYPRYVAEVLYMPPTWVKLHAQDIVAEHPTGTGESDYALLRVVGTTSGAPLPPSFPALLPDTRNAIGFTGDRVLTASYPAEFVGGIVALRDLYPVSAMTNIKELLTFGDNSVDAISLGSVISAQSGSSGGAVVNAWDRLVGIITTTSEGTTTAQRDLRATTLSYIDRDLTTQTGQTLAQFISGDLSAKAEEFNAVTGPKLVEQLLAHIPHQQ